jgi:hypothetical protein
MAVANARLYFIQLVTDACGQSNVALASCAINTVPAATCTPQIHATSFGLLGAKSMAVSTTRAFVTGQDGNTYRVML